MRYRALTVAREYGSGGAAVAKLVAARLGWRLLDNALVQEIARSAQVSPELVRQFDEKLDSWLHRVSRAALWQGGIEGVAGPVGTNVFDAETEAQLAGDLIQEAYQQGQCVIVGRAGQCLLQQKPDVFHAYVYAPWAHRVERIRKRAPECGDVATEIVNTDRVRSQYVKARFGCQWSDPHLYDLMVCSGLGEEEAASIIVQAMSVGSEA